MLTLRGLCGEHTFMQMSHTRNISRQEDDGVKQYLVSVPFALHVVVETEDPDSITEDQVMDALLDQHGKYAEVDVRNAGEFEVLGED